MLRTLLPILALAPILLPGAEIAWGGGNGTWADAGKWTGGVCPGQADVAVFAGDAGTIEVAAPATVGGVALKGPGKGTLRVRGDLVVGPADGEGSPLTSAADGPVAVEIQGRRLTLRRGRVGTVTLAGSWTMTKGSTLELLSTAGGGFRFVNTGTLVQDGGTVLFHWTQAADATRMFHNMAGATWRLAGGSTVALNHEKGDESASHTILETSRNDGEMRIEGGSQLPVVRFDNAGQLILGECRLGGPAKFECLVRNEAKGVVSIVGEALIGHPEPQGSVWARLENGREDQQGATLRIGDGTVPATLTITSGTMSVANAAGCSTEVAAKATLALLSPTHEAAGNSSRGTTIINRGEWTQRGRLQFRPVQNAAQIAGINNWGTLRFAGAEVAIERLPARNPHFKEGAETSIFNNRSGVLGGTATVAYANQTGIPVGDRMLVISSGTIAPGTPERVGTLAFVNTDVRFSDTGTGRLAIRVAGPDAADRLELTGTHGGALVLSEEGASLSVTVLPGFAATKPTSWRIVSAKRVEGGFSATELPKGFSVATDAEGVLLTYRP
jgi:hypothetical protein